MLHLHYKMHLNIDLSDVLYVHQGDIVSSHTLFKSSLYPTINC